MSVLDQFNKAESLQTIPLEKVIAFTPHDIDNFSIGLCRAFCIAVAGVVAVVYDDDSVENLTLPAGWHPIRCKRINSTNTTATGISAGK